MKLSDEQLALGRERFLEKHPAARAKVMEMNQAMADALGVELTKLQVLETHKEIDAYSRMAGEDSFEFFLRFVLDDDEELQRVICAVREESMRALGLV